MVYKVKWTQTLVGEFEIEARSEEEAKDKVLYSGDFDVDEIVDNKLEVIEKWEDA